jgi:hypothetical protein
MVGLEKSNVDSLLDFEIQYKGVKLNMGYKPYMLSKTPTCYPKQNNISSLAINARLNQTLF